MHWKTTMDIYFSIFLCILPGFIHALRDVSVIVPFAVRRGETVRLICKFNMEEDTLYSVKWYKGGHEFYRYTPKQDPDKQVFRREKDGLNVIIAMSNETQVTLSAVPLLATGRYSCEVSADSPSFHTLIGNGDLVVVEPPEGKPILSGIETYYRIGDTIKGNCTSRNSKPRANLTWTINDKPIAANHQKHYRSIKTHDNRETVTIGIHMVIGPNFFGNLTSRRAKIICKSEIHNVYSQTSEKTITQQKLRRKQAPQSNSVNIYNPSEQSEDDEFLPNSKDGFMAQDDISSSSGKHFSLSSSLAFYIIIIIIINTLLIQFQFNVEILNS